ncbi:MAG: hypothetical protein M1335_00735, partial [Chloroflexi bacterium]|nr:hypothetical protein [Chloroflexota bacterium]
YTREFKDPVFVQDPERRCFICKTMLFENVRAAASRRGFKNLLDGTNLDDSKENRPIFAVPKEFGVKWPLVEAGLGTADVQQLLKYLGFGRYARPHYSCSAWEVDLGAAAE